MRIRILLPRRARDISAADALRRVRAGALLLDVRTHDEWDRAHATDAVHMPIAELEQRIHEVPRDREIVTVCTAGIRSAAAADRLRAAGFTAYSLRSGMPGWRRTGGATTRAR